MPIVISVFYLALTVGVLIDVIRSDDASIRNLNKIFWVAIVLFFPLVGSILWFAVGRGSSPSMQTLSIGDPRRVENQAAVTPAKSIEDELAELDREIEHHEKQARIRRLETELRERKKDDDSR